jgi:hypothetical protein
MECARFTAWEITDDFMADRGQPSQPRRPETFR